ERLDRRRLGQLPAADRGVARGPGRHGRHAEWHRHDGLLGLLRLWRDRADHLQRLGLRAYGRRPLAVRRPRPHRRPPVPRYALGSRPECGGAWGRCGVRSARGARDTVQRHAAAGRVVTSDREADMGLRYAYLGPTGTFTEAAMRQVADTAV